MSAVIAQNSEISEETLEVFEYMRNAIVNEPNGGYSINRFLEGEAFEFENDYNAMVYRRNSKLGDSVVENASNNAKILWTEREANKEEHSAAIVLSDKQVLKAGECIALLENINDSTQTPLYVVKSFVSIPKGYLGITTKSTNKEPGFLVVVPELIKADICADCICK